MKLKSTLSLTVCCAKVALLLSDETQCRHHSFIHSFIHSLRECVYCNVYCTVFIRFYNASHSMGLSEAPPAATVWHCVGVYLPKRYRQLQVKDLPKVPMWRLERDLNPRPSGWKASTLPMRHHASNCTSSRRGTTQRRPQPERDHINHLKMRGKPEKGF